MKKILFFIISIFISLNSSASHVAGGEVSYEYIGDSTGIPYHYSVFVTLYRDTHGASLGNTVTVRASSSCYSSLVIQAEQQTDGADGPWGSYLIPYLDDCGNVDSNRYVKHIYHVSMILPGPCGDWSFGVAPPCCKNGDVQNLNDLGDTYFKATLNNLYGENKMLETAKIDRSLVLCAGKPVSIKPFANQDPDEDSILVRLTHLLRSPDFRDTIPFATGYSVDNPISTTNGIHIDQKTGTINFTPSQEEMVMLAFEASEYRFDSTALTYYLAGRHSIEVTIIVTENCREDVVSWQLNDFELADVPKVDCFDQWISLKSNKTFNPQSLTPTDFRVFGSDGIPYPVVEVETDSTGETCASEIHLKLFRELTENDTLTVYSKVGNDGNSVINSCGYELMGDSIQLLLSNCSVSLLENESTDISIYPNPVGKRLYIRDEQHILQGEVKVNIFNQTGQLMRESVPERNGELYMETDGLAPGMYFLRVYDQNGSRYSERFFVE